MRQFHIYWQTDLWENEERTKKQSYKFNVCILVDFLAVILRPWPYHIKSVVRNSAKKQLFFSWNEKKNDENSIK